MASRIEDLYEEDFYVWTQRQAAALRRLAATRPNVDLDLLPPAVDRLLPDCPYASTICSPTTGTRGNRRGLPGDC